MRDVVHCDLPDCRSAVCVEQSSWMGWSECGPASTRVRQRAQCRCGVHSNCVQSRRCTAVVERKMIRKLHLSFGDSDIFNRDVFNACCMPILRQPERGDRPDLPPSTPPVKTVAPDLVPAENVGAGECHGEAAGRQCQQMRVRNAHNDTLPGECGCACYEGFELSCDQSLCNVKANVVIQDPDSEGCPNDQWFRIGEYCYIGSQETMTIEKGKQFCANHALV